MPSTYSTSNTNYVISVPNSQADYFAIQEDVLPQKTVGTPPVEYYAPNRNLHTYSVMSHGEKTN